jgi:hypothetical protein
MAPVVGSIVVMPKDVEALQRAVHADAETVRLALQRCADAGNFSPTKTPAEWDAWDSLMKRVRAFVAEVPSFLSSGSQADRGDALQKELAQWHDKARALGCDVAAAPVLPVQPGFDLSTLFAGASTTALLVLAILWAMRK